jgi:hypothetical protein
LVSAGLLSLGSDLAESFVSGFSFLEAVVELTRRVRFTGFSSWLSTIVFISHFFTAKPCLQNLI